MSEKKITFASKELKEFKRQLEQTSVRNILAAQGVRMENSRNFADKIYWPPKGDYVVWAYKSDGEEFWKGVEEFCQYIYDLKIKPGDCPPRPKNGNTSAIRYRYFNLLSQRYNSGYFKLQFNELD